VDKHFALWVNRHGQRFWQGPFETEGRAWGHLQQIIDAQNSCVICGTQMSKPAPSAPDARPAGNEFETAKPGDRGGERGPWFIASYQSPCAGGEPDCAGTILEGDDIRADGDGGWLCLECGQRE
jgi:hypothetical protein